MITPPSKYYKQLRDSDNSMINFSSINQSLAYIDFSGFIDSSGLSDNPETRTAINNIKDLISLHNALISESSQRKSDYEIRNFDFSNIEINSDTIAIINKFVADKGQKYYLKIQTLKMQDFYGVDFELTHNFQEILVLSFGGIFDGGKLLLSDLSALKLLEIEDLGNNSTLILSDSTNNLRKLSIARICRRSKLILPQSLPILKTLMIQEIQDGVTLTLPHLYSIKTIQIGTIWDGVTLALPQDLSHLEILNIGNIWDNTTVAFPKSLEKLKHLSLGNILHKTSIALPQALNTLESFSIGDVGIDLIIPNSLNNLSSLKIGNICNGAKLIFPEKLENLKELVIGNLGDNCILELPNELPKIEKPFIGTIGTNARVKWPEKFNNTQNQVMNNQHRTIILKNNAEFSNIKIINYK